MALRDWLRAMGIGYRRAAKILGINRSTLVHYINDKRYRKRCTPQFHGRIGARVRHRIVPLVNHNGHNDKGRICPYCGRPID